MSNGKVVHRTLAVLAALVALVTALVGRPATVGAEETQELLPIVFVHGGAGSAQQYQTQAMRFDSNGYPAELIYPFEYNSGSIAAIIAAPSQLDALIDGIRAARGVEQVHLVGHSLGTSVSSSYLGQPARAAKVASYIGIDGQQGAACPGEVPCLGVFANTTGNLGGNNLHLPHQTHVEVATSADSFAGQYAFITGEPPATTLVLPEPPGQVQVSGRVVNFPANSGLAGATLRVFELNSRTGARTSAPVAVHQLDPTGDFGPVAVNGLRHYEFEVIRDDGAPHGHVYFQPFIRSTHLLRVLQSPAGSAILANTNTGDHHTAGTISRQREWWSTRDAGIGGSDQLWVSTTSASLGDQPPFQIFGAATGNNTIGVHIHDAAASPGQTTGDLLPFFPTQAFQTGVDVFMPAAGPPDGTVTFVNAPRGDLTRPQVLNILNWASSQHRIGVNFNDYVQDINTWGECMRTGACR
jgi:pimeloyl-ACP methyl ester carboxylesterase